MAKTIVFCDNQEHAERMRQELVKIIPAAAHNRRYVMRITGDDKEGKDQLSYFTDNDEPFPVIATTSRLLSTGVDAKTCKLIVLDKTINSMTEFKQIIGRGTRIREDYHKLYFTIMDFKGATRLFADPDFDGEPVTIYEPEPDEPVVPDEEEQGPDEMGEESGPYGPIPPLPPDGPPPINRYYLDDVDVRSAVERSQYLDEDGKLVTEDYRVLLRHEIRKTIQGEFASLDDFLKRWTDAERKRAVLDELAERGVPVDALREAVPDGGGLDAFDLVAHVAFDQKPLTRLERANNVKKRNYFGKYGEQARAVLEALLEKYAEHGIVDLEDPRYSNCPPFTQFGTKTQIRRVIFDGSRKFTEALTELERALYEEMTA